MRNAITAGDATELVTRLTKKDIIRICQWKYDWKTLYNRLVDKYGLYYLRQGPSELRNFTFKANILTEIEMGTTPLLPDEADKFLDRLIAGDSSGDQHGPHSPRRLAGAAGGTALVLAKDYAEANKYLKQLSTYALGLKAGLDAPPRVFEPEDAYIDDINDLGQGDPFAREGDVPEDEPEEGYEYER
jgi:hypothetical protein